MNFEPKSGAATSTNRTEDFRCDEICQPAFPAEQLPAEVFFDALANTARLIATRSLLPESAARRGDWQGFVENMRIASAGLVEARGIAAMAGRERH